MYIYKNKSTISILLGPSSKIDHMNFADDHALNLNC